MARPGILLSDFPVGYKLASFDKLSSLEVLTFAHQTKDSVERVEISKGKPLKSIDDYYKY